MSCLLNVGAKAYASSSTRIFPSYCPTLNLWRKTFRARGIKISKNPDLSKHFMRDEDPSRASTKEQVLAFGK